jgi:hypothetical protein
MSNADDPNARMRQLIMGFRASQLVYVAARLGLVDELANGPRNASALAAAVGAAPQPLYRLLRALASIGILTEAEDGTFASTALAHPLRRDAPGSLRSTALLYGDPLFWSAYGRMLHSIQTGETAFEHAHGRPMYAHLAADEATRSLFHQAMRGFSEQEIASILDVYDFSDQTTLVDVGGGQGALVAALLQACPRPRGIVFDREDVAESARHLLAQAGLTKRASFVGGNFFENVPPDGSAYLLKSVIHNWNDDDARKILANCRQAMSPTARLIVIERVIPDAGTPSEAKLFDINMLVTVGGQERTADEYRALLRTAGFALTRIVPTTSPLSLIEAVPDAG